MIYHATKKEKKGLWLTNQLSRHGRPGKTKDIWLINIVVLISVIKVIYIIIYYCTHQEFFKRLQLLLHGINPSVQETIFDYQISSIFFIKLSIFGASSEEIKM